MQQKTSKMFTYQTRIDVDDNVDKTLTITASLLSKVERSLFKDYYIKNKSLNELKSLYIKKFQITARQFNSIRSKLDGKISSYKTNLNERISLLKTKVKKLEKNVKKIKDPFKKHQKNRRLFLLKTKLENLEKDIQDKKIRICFGSKQLFKKQFNLEENGYSSHKEWKKDWEFSRNNSFFIIGSKDETAGNQTCQLIKNDGKLALRLRLPNIFSEKTIILENITFAYGQEEILKAIEENEKRKNLKALKNDNYKYFGKAINYLFKKDKKSWNVFITIEKEKPALISKKNIGAIGIDINANHIALSETDRFGNFLNKKNIPLCTYGKTKNQSIAIIKDAAKEIVKEALLKQKPLVLENLDFTKKKQNLREQSNKYSRMLSSFSYSTTIDSIETKAFKEGIEILKINPAFTSIIGRVKFENRYGLSSHQSAALVIARRACNYSERLPSYLEIKDNKNSKVAFFLPVKDRKKHVWSYYSKLNKNLKTANVLHSSTKFRSSRPEKPLCDILDSVIYRGGSGMLIVGKTARSTCQSKSFAYA